MTIQPQSLQRHCPLDNGLLQQSTVLEAKCAAPSDIGDLEFLPIELIHSVFNILDLQNPTNFKAIIWRARALVDSFPPYYAIVKHSPNALRALLSTNMTIHFTAQDISAHSARNLVVVVGNLDHSLIYLPVIDTASYV